MMVELMPVQIHFTNDTTLRCCFNRCFDVEGFGRCPVDELRRGDVIMEGANFWEWRTVESVDLGNKKAALSVGADAAANGKVVDTNNISQDFNDDNRRTSK
jgi:hypothetical protein